MSKVAPRVAWLTDALLASPGEDVSSTELAQLRDELGRDLHALGAELPPGRRLQIDAFKVLIAHRQPERCMTTDDVFVPSPRLCRRAVAVAAVNRCVRGLAPCPSVAVAEVLAQGVEDASVAAETAAVRAPWWATWYSGLPFGGRAVVEAESVTWATQLLTAVDWQRMPGLPVIGGRDDWWQCPGGSPLVLKGRADVRAFAQRRPALLVVGSGRCRGDWRVELGYPALVGALGADARRAPCRVVGIWPQSGQIRVLAVDLAALRATAAATISAVATWVDGQLEAQRTSSGADSPRSASVDEVAV